MVPLEIRCGPTASPRCSATAVSYAWIRVELRSVGMDLDFMTLPAFEIVG